MHSEEEAEILTRVGPGTPMGEVFRRYWLPALLSSEIAEPDCPPVQALLLGEHVGLPDVQRGRLQLGGGQPDRDRGAGRVHGESAALEPAEVDVGDDAAVARRDPCAPALRSAGAPGASAEASRRTISMI